MIEKKVIVMVLLAGLWATPAHAEFDLAHYRDFMQHEDTREKLADYVTGLGRGVFWANIFVESKSQPPLFCMPPKLELSEGLIASVLAQEIETPVGGKPYADKTPIEMIMVKGFMGRFPCGPEGSRPAEDAETGKPSAESK
jgi:hypothetical protein